MSVEETEVEQPEVILEVEAPEGETPDVADAEQDDEQTVIAFGDEQPEVEPEVDNAAPEWVKNLRKEAKEQRKRIKELEKELEAKSKPAVQVNIDPGPKPTLADHDYDEDRFQAAYADWAEQDLKAKAQRRKAEEAAEAQQREFQERQAAFLERKAKLKVPDFEDAEEVVGEILSPQQLGIIVHAVDDPEQLIYALGKNPAKARALAAQTDFIRFTAEAVKLKAQINVSSRKAPPPERRVGGANAPLSASNLQARIDAALEKAQKTGDISEYRELRKLQREG